MFGRFAVDGGGAAAAQLEGRKVQELISYLLLFRAKAHRREVVADALWGASETTQSRKYLRQALWKLHGALDGGGRPDDAVLLIDPGWIQLNPAANLWLDVAVVEAAYDATRGTRGEDLDPDRAITLGRAVDLYRGDLLEGWYQEWCLLERERLKTLHIMAVEKLLVYHETNRQFDEGFACGERILRQDRAHERTHWRIMRLRYLAGDRTGAMRQYEACVAALREELDVAPSERTTTLYEQIRTDDGRLGLFAQPRDSSGTGGVDRLHAHALERGVAAETLHEALAALTRAEQLVRESLQVLRED
jgi:DNA-binding transcriptional activator of the SARP family